MDTKTRLIFFSFLPIFLGFSACCWRCEETPPDVGSLKVRVSDDITDNIRIRIYEGEGVLDSAIIKDTISSTYSYTLPTGQYYTGEAIYEKNGKKVIAVDKDDITIKDRSDRDCADSVCYIPGNGALDLKLKRTPF